MNLWASGLFDSASGSMRLILAVQLGLFGAGWALAWALLAEERRAIAHWCVSALLFSGSMLLIQLASPPHAMAGANVAVMLVNLLAYGLAARGADVFVHEHARHDNLVLGAVGVTTLAVLLAAEPADDRMAVLLFSVGKAALLIGMPVLMLRRLAMTMGWLGTVVALLPSVSYGVLGLANAWGYLLAGPPSGNLGATLLDTPPKVIVAMVAAALFNFSFLFMLLSRLVTQLRHHALHDMLTGVLNRRAAERVLERMWRRHGHAPGWTFTAVLVDVDHFKRVNDQHGHPVGDMVLRKVAEVLQASLRPSDTVARLGGEEFLLLLPGLDAARARPVAERVRAAVAAAAVDLRGVPLRVTVSAGIAQPRRNDTSHADVLARADAALYFAKGAGRNRVADEAALLGGVA